MLQMVPLFYHKTDFVSLHMQMVDGLPFANLMSTTDHLTAQVLSQTVKSVTSLWTFV